MQLAFDFGAPGEIADAWRCLSRHFGPADMGPPRTPVGQLVKSLISNRTYDAISLRAYQRLIAALSWTEIATAPASQIEMLISDVEFAEIKARHLGMALRQVEDEHPDFDLRFLQDLSETAALAWLERLPGVGPKVAASVLNFSTLNRPAFVIDTHVLRILRRLGVVGRSATTSAAYDRVMGALADWSATELADLHVQMKRLGQTICRAQRPCCGDCPLVGSCVTSIRAETS